MINYLRIRSVSSKRFFPILLIILCWGCGKREKEKIFYPNGKLQMEFEVKNGKRDGLLIEYYESGRIKSRGFWSDGVQNGEVVFYHPNGILEQQYEYKDGTLCCEASFFRDDGSLQEIQYYDKIGKMIDFKKFDQNGNQNLDLITRLPVIVPLKDTIEIHEYYVGKIRLGNRRFNDIEVIFGEHNDPNLLTKERLTKSDSVTAVFRVKPSTYGSQYIEGVILEKNTHHPDSLLVVPFKKFFFVKGQPKKT